MRDTALGDHSTTTGQMATAGCAWPTGHHTRWERNSVGLEGAGTPTIALTSPGHQAARVQQQHSVRTEVSIEEG